MVAFCGRILALGICKCLGANARGFPGMAADKCINAVNTAGRRRRLWV